MIKPLPYNHGHSIRNKEVRGVAGSMSYKLQVSRGTANYILYNQIGPENMTH